MLIHAFCYFWDLVVVSVVMKAKAKLESIGAQELRIARAVFIFREKGKEGIAGLVAILSLYVDDGLLFGDPKDPRFQRIRKQVDPVFNIKHWKALGLHAEKYLGMQWQSVKEGSALSLCIHMDEYIDKMVHNLEIVALVESEALSIHVGHRRCSY